MAQVTYTCNGALSPTDWNNVSYLFDSSASTYATIQYNTSSSIVNQNCLFCYYDSTSIIDIDSTSITSVEIGIRGKKDQYYNDLYAYSELSNNIDSTSAIYYPLQYSMQRRKWRVPLDTTSQIHWLDITPELSNTTEILDRYIILYSMSTHPLINSYSIYAYVSEVYWRIEYVI